MFSRVLRATTVLLALSPALSLAQLTPVSGSRGISASITGVPVPYSYSNSASVHVPSFNDNRSVNAGGVSGQLRIESELLSDRWWFEGSVNATNVGFPPGDVAITNMSSSASLSFFVEAGTTVSVNAFCRGSYGGFNSHMAMGGGGFNFSTMGGQMGTRITLQRLVTEPSLISISASGSVSGQGAFGDRFGLYEVTITATAPAPGACGLLAAAAVFASRRRR